MEIKPGYKQTEAGVIPEDWEVKLLPDVCRFRGGKAHEQYISDFGRFVCVNSKFISTNGNVRKYSSANFCCAKCGDILMVMSDLPNGRALAKAFLADQDDFYAVNQRVCALTPYRDCSKYLFYVLNRNSYFLKLDDGVNQTHLLNHVFQKCPLPIPPSKAEQEAIAEALSDADALIESMEQLIAKKRRIKQGAMQELLAGRRRLPGFEGKWEFKRLGDLLLASPDYGINAPATKPSGDLPTYLRITDIDDHGNFRKNDRVAVNHPDSENFFLSANEVVFARTGASVGKTYLYKPSDGKMVFAGFLIRAKIDGSKLNPVFFFNLTTTSSYWNWVRIMSMRSGQPGINGNEYASLEFCVPPTLAEQTAIATILSDMDAEIEALEAKLSKARQIKQGMVQELLTGKIRLV